MKGLKVILCGLGLMLLALFCCLGSAYSSYVVGLIFGILFVIAGIALIVIGLFVDDSFADLKAILGSLKSASGKKPAADEKTEPTVTASATAEPAAAETAAEPEKSEESTESDKPEND